MSEDISKIISKYKMYMSFDKNEYEMIQKIELNKLLDYIQQKENIIKEVREYIKVEKVIKEGNTLEQITNYEKKLLEILDKKESK